MSQETQEIRKRVEELFATEITPALGIHGGFVELVDVKGNSIYIRMGGSCQGCGMANFTLKMGIEAVIRQQIPEVGEIVDATDHTEERNPFYMLYQR